MTPTTFPGCGLCRKGGAISRVALTLLLATAKQQLDGGALDIRIPAEEHYRGLLRTRELTPGMLAAVVLADPAVNQCLQATAEARDITVLHAEHDVMDTTPISGPSRSNRCSRPS